MVEDSPFRGCGPTGPNARTSSKVTQIVKELPEQGRPKRAFLDAPGLYETAFSTALGAASAVDGAASSRVAGRG